MNTGLRASPTPASAARRADLRRSGQLQPARARARCRRGVPARRTVRAAACGSRAASCRGLSARAAGVPSAHHQVRVGKEDPEGRKKLAGTMLRAPMSLEKMTYDAQTGTVIYRSKMHLSLKRFLLELHFYAIIFSVREGE